MVNKAEIQGYDISDKSAVVIGCGGLGVNICTHLAGAGIGKLTVCDYDVVEEKNLNRQFLYKASMIGKPKCEMAKAFLSSYAPDISVNCINKKITFVDDLDFAKATDIVILAVDNIDARKIVQEFCHKNNIPLINGGVNGFFGNAYIYVPLKTPCLACAGMLQSNNSKTTNSSSTVGIIGAIESQLAINYFLNKDYTNDSELIIYDNLNVKKLKIKSNNKCDYCKL